MTTTRTRCLAALPLLASLSLLAPPAAGHGPADSSYSNLPGREIQFPDTADRLTLAVDLHTHSVFSDGHVWPKIRVEEALRDGLDAMAITEHLEWQPHLEDIPHPDRNRSYEEALASLPEGSELILIAGSEITRQAPHGHMNAVFIEDANALVQRGTPTEPFDLRTYYYESATWPAQEAVDEANAQGGFVFWNHSWSDFPNATTTMTDFHRQAAAAGKLHGIEIANGDTYSPESFQIALDHGLTPIGVSDVHNLIDWDYEPHNGGHRPVNLVFTETRSAEAIRKALFEGRTVVWFDNLLMGRERDLLPLLNASLSASAARYRGEGSVLEVELDNVSDADFELENLTDLTLVRSAKTVLIPAHDSLSITLRVPERRDSLTLRFRVRNALLAPDTHPEMAFEVAPE